MKSIRPILIGAAALVAAGYGISSYSGREVRELQGRVQELEKERTQLVEFAERLTASRRVAQVDVLDRRTDEAGRSMTTLRWQEIGADGALAVPQTIEVLGESAYFEAMVIKFEFRRVREAEAGRAASLAVFRRIFGEMEPPEEGDPLPAPSGLSAADAEMWRRFWEIVNDPKLAAKYGIRTAQCEAPSVPLAPGQTWEVSLDAAGGLNVRKIGGRAIETVPSTTTNDSL
ncbi:MAG TPA: hypothetical protein VJZ71_08975 [Phycisphaerae bacterium]|nr:hypothetical protein [Phycisphaerae bacterium]